MTGGNLVGLIEGTFLGAALFLLALASFFDVEAGRSPLGLSMRLWPRPASLFDDDDELLELSCDLFLFAVVWLLPSSQLLYDEDSSELGPGSLSTMTDFPFRFFGGPFFGVLRPIACRPTSFLFIIGRGPSLDVFLSTIAGRGDTRG